MNLDELSSKIKADLMKSGFASEMRALNCFKEEEWIATGSNTFFDLDENKSRESDISGYLTDYKYVNGKNIAQSYFHISAEVKKSEKPWIVFKEIPHWEHSLLEGWSNLIFTAGIPGSPPPKNLTKAINKHTLSSSLGWLGNGIHEFNKSPDQPSKWYSALISVCKAAEDDLKANSWEKPSEEGNPHLNIVKPLIILDGLFIAASLKNDDIVLEQIEAATIDFNFSTLHYQRGRYKVDVVVLDYLKKYLKLCKLRHKAIYKVIEEIGLKKIKKEL